jgi:16S rRNA (guanine527-N7)-methyltransferase
MIDIDSLKKDERLTKFKILIEEWNEKMNLTAISDETSFFDKHFFDSLNILNYISIADKSVLDVGSGAGFPGIPLAIYSPSSKISLLEATSKKCEFLRAAVEELNLNNITILNKRSEEIAEHERESFNVVLSRAVGRIKETIELTSPYLRVGGKLILYKGPSYKDELSEASSMLDELNLKLSDVKKYKLPDFDEYRYYVIFEKLAKTSKRYPRSYSIIKKGIKR